MGIKSILFSTPMVQKILAGCKTMTRRVMKPQPVLTEDGMWHWKDCQWMDGGIGFPKSGTEDHAPFKVGDILWVRERWAKYCDRSSGKTEQKYIFYAGGTWGELREDCDDADLSVPWKPSIYMPKEAARLFLRVTDVRMERLQDITGNLDELEREGISIVDGAFYASVKFAELWDNTIAIVEVDDVFWDANPWVWGISFERCGRPADFPAAINLTGGADT